MAVTSKAEKNTGVAHKDRLIPKDCIARTSRSADHLPTQKITANEKPKGNPSDNAKGIIREISSMKSRGDIERARKRASSFLDKFPYKRIIVKTRVERRVTPNISLKI
jgi:hypothetical protein